jgi:hypothetical protein
MSKVIFVWLFPDLDFLNRKATSKAAGRSVPPETVEMGKAE